MSRSKIYEKKMIIQKLVLHGYRVTQIITVKVGKQEVTHVLRIFHSLVQHGTEESCLKMLNWMTK